MAGSPNTFTPLSKALAADQEHAALVVSGVDQLEEEIGTVGGDQKITDLVDGQEHCPYPDDSRLSYVLSSRLFCAHRLICRPSGLADAVGVGAIVAASSALVEL